MISRPHNGRKKGAKGYRHLSTIGDDQDSAEGDLDDEKEEHEIVIYSGPEKFSSIIDSRGGTKCSSTVPSGAVSPKLCSQTIPCPVQNGIDLGGSAESLFVNSAVEQRYDSKHCSMKVQQSSATQLGNKLMHDKSIGNSGILPPPDAQIQNMQTSKIYVFGEGDIEEILEDGDNVGVELRTRGGNNTHLTSYHSKEDTFVERTITEGDTLQSLSIKYRCPVSEVKRINNLISDVDFYSRKVIRIPAKKHGLLIEEAERGVDPALKRPKPVCDDDCDDDYDSHPKPDCSVGTGERLYSYDYSTNLEAELGENSQLLVRTLSIPSLGQGKAAREFLQKMDEDIRNIVDSTPSSKKQSLQEAANALTCRTISPLEGRLNPLDGADCGISGKNILLVLVVVCLVLPFAYYIFLSRKHH